MTKKNVTLGRKIWPTERKLINRIITKQKGYHNKPYPAKNKIPTKALHSVSGALNILDQAEKKKANKGHIRSYRKKYEHKEGLPEAHYMAFKKSEKKVEEVKKEEPPPPKMKAPPKTKAVPKEEDLTERTKELMKETKEQRSARLQASLAAARAAFVAPEAIGGSKNLKTVINQQLSSNAKIEKAPKAAKAKSTQEVFMSEREKRKRWFGR